MDLVEGGGARVVDRPSAHEQVVARAAAKRVGDAEGTFILVADDPRILRELQGTGLDRDFALERTLSAAIDVALGVGKAGSA